MTKPITHTQAERIVKLLICCFLVVVLTLAYMAYQAYSITIVSNQRAGCERIKLDRRDNVDFQVAYINYVNRVALELPTKRDVTDITKEATKIFDNTSSRLAKRAKIDCAHAYPDTRFLP